jgi:hypothetical protein
MSTERTNWKFVAFYFDRFSSCGPHSYDNVQDSEKKCTPYVRTDVTLIRYWTVTILYSSLPWFRILSFPFGNRYYLLFKFLLRIGEILCSVAALEVTVFQLDVHEMLMLFVGTVSHEDVWGAGGIATPSLPRHYMEASGQLHIPSA